MTTPTTTEPTAQDIRDALISALSCIACMSKYHGAELSNPTKVTYNEGIALIDWGRSFEEKCFPYPMEVK